MPPPSPGRVFLKPAPGESKLFIEHGADGYARRLIASMEQEAAQKRIGYPQLARERLIETGRRAATLDGAVCKAFLQSSARRPQP